jgi:endonuclease YncB( thermonuclease family)
MLPRSFAAVLLLPAMLVCALPLPASEILDGPFSAEVLRVIDGDTIEVRIQVWLGQTLETDVRLAGIDAPEMRGRCASEREGAAAARARLEALVAEAGGVVILRRVEDGIYAGRVVATVATPAGEDLGARLIAAGLARTYDGQRARDGWCG